MMEILPLLLLNLERMDGNRLASTRFSAHLQLKVFYHVLNFFQYLMWKKIHRKFCHADEVFLDTQPLIRSVLDGYNVCIFAYGQTGSGKTFTMVSSEDNSTMPTISVCNTYLSRRPSLFLTSSLLVLCRVDPRI